MAKKQPEEKLEELKLKQAKIEEQLKEKRAKIIRQKRREQAKLTNKKRKEDTRRKILVGAAILEKVKNNEWPEDRLLMMMSWFLDKNEDRVLFGLNEIDVPDEEKDALSNGTDVATIDTDVANTDN